MSDQALSRRQFLLGRFRSDADDPPGNTSASRTVSYPRNQDDLLAAFTATTTRRRRSGSIPLLRPPGAVHEVIFLKNCTQCGDCIAACPPEALVKAPRRFREAAGTPMLDPSTAPCVLCTETPCIAACQPGVLSDEFPIRMGTARIDTQVCLAHQGSFCSSCRERCPVPNAIHVEDGRPSIVEDVCTGCGVCHHVCPAPHNAVAIMPQLVRPQFPLVPRAAHD